MILRIPQYHTVMRKGGLMEIIDNFTLQEHKIEYENRPRESILYFSGNDTGVKVPGYFIERQFELPNYYLLLNNWDCPFEEGYEVVVLNKQCQVVGNHSFVPPCSIVTS